MTMFKTVAKAALVVVSLFAFSVSLRTEVTAQEKPSPRDIMEKVFEARKLDGSEAVSTLTIYNQKGQKRVRKMAMVTKLYDGGRTEKKLSRFLSPADVKGTGFMTFDYEKKDDDMWMYMPSLRKTRRIVSSEKSKSFMGSEFAYVDMNIPILDNYTYKLLMEEKAGGVDCWVIESTPKDEDIADEDGYSKKSAWIGKADYTIRKAAYYDLDGELLKELTAENIKLIDPKKKRYRPMKLEMINRQNGRRSVLTIDRIVLKEDVKDEYFTTRYLERE